MKKIFVGIVIVALTLMTTSSAGAGEAMKSFDFALDAWNEVDTVDGPVKLHRVRLDRKEERISKALLARPYNQEYLDLIRITLEYTNEASAAWKARLEVRWLDAEGQVIDGFGANEKLAKKAARQVVRVSVPTLKYGIEQAETLEVTVHFQP